MMNWACGDSRDWGETHPLWWIASWRIFCDGYHHPWFLSLYLLHSSMNPGKVKGWRWADFNTLWTLVALFFIYRKSVVIRIARMKGVFLYSQTNQEELYYEFLSIFKICSIVYPSQHRASGEGQECPNKSIITGKCARGMSCRHSYAIGFVASRTCSKSSSGFSEESFPACILCLI